MGREKKVQRHNVPIKGFFTMEEKLKLEYKANQLGLSLSQLIRKMTCGHKFFNADASQVLVSLNQICTALAAIDHNQNASRPGDTDSVAKIQTQLESLLRKLLEELR